MTRDILELLRDELQVTINRDEVREIERSIWSENDFSVEIDGGEYRFINEDAIWDIFVDEIQQLTEDCYTGKLEWWIEVDWEKTAENCLQDGYGHHFAGYDGIEYEWKIEEENYYIFRIG